MEKIMSNLMLRLAWTLVLSALAGVVSAQTPPAKTDYVLGAGDVVKVTVFQSPELSLETRIAESGVVNYPLLGAMKLGGLTIGEAEQKLADGLLAGKFVKRPQVSIFVTQLRGSQASVLGYAVRPGRYALERANTRLSDLMAQAGGVAANGSELLTVVGTRNGKQFRKQVDIRTLFRSDSASDDIVVQDNDVVYVDRMPEIYIYGEVQRPGALRLERGMTVMQAIAAGGGLTQRGTQRGLRVHRKGPDGVVKELSPQLHDPLSPNDVIYVQESLF